MHVLYLSQIYIFSVSSFHAFLLFIGRFMMQTFNVTQQPAVIVFNSQGESEASAYFRVWWGASLIYSSIFRSALITL